MCFHDLDPGAQEWYCAADAGAECVGIVFFTGFEDLDGVAIGKFLFEIGEMGANGGVWELTLDGK